jgi:hypothetical protein
MGGAGTDQKGQRRDATFQLCNTVNRRIHPHIQRSQ